MYYKSTKDWLQGFYCLDNCTNFFDNCACYMLQLYTPGSFLSLSVGGWHRVDYLFVILRADEKAYRRSAWLNWRSILCVYRPSSAVGLGTGWMKTSRSVGSSKASRLLPPFSQVRSVCSGYTSTRQPITRSRVREVLMPCFQSSEGKCSEGCARIYRSCVMTPQS